LGLRLIFPIRKLFFRFYFDRKKKIIIWRQEKLKMMITNFT
jgi:hypothetical protein